MAGMRSDRARARARNLLATVYPVPDDTEFHRLRELAIDYIKEAERIKSEGAKWDKVIKDAKIRIE